MRILGTERTFLTVNLTKRKEVSKLEGVSQTVAGPCLQGREALERKRQTRLISWSQTGECSVLPISLGLPSAQSATEADTELLTWKRGAFMSPDLLAVGAS